MAERSKIAGMGEKAYTGAMKAFSISQSTELAGPAKEAPAVDLPYSPVDCDFTDELESAAVKRVPLLVMYWEGSVLREQKALVKDLVTERHEEFLILSTGQKIRLDHLHLLRILPV